MPIVTNPTAGDVHVNRPLTNFSQKYLQDQSRFIATRAMPNMPVSKQSDLYYVFSRADFFRDEAEERADGTESAGGSFTLSTDPYFARVYAFHKDVTDRQRANQDELVRLDESAAQYVTQKLLIKREQDFLDAYFGTGIWTATGSDAAVGTAWDADNSTPIEDVRDALSTVHGATGYRPNKMIITREGLDALLDNDEILTRILGGATNSVPAMVQRQLLAQLFEMDEIHVIEAVKNSAAKGAAESTAFMGTAGQALVYYAPNSVGIEEPTAGSTFSWTGFMGATGNGMRIKRFRKESVEADRVEGQMSYDHKVVASELGFLFTGITT